MASLAEIRAKLAAQGNNNSSNTDSKGESVVYPHWNINDNSNARLRFLPDANTENTFFWVERAMIKLPFPGIKGQPDSSPIVVQVPCMEMYSKDSVCPILSEVRGWFKDPNLEDMGRKYWKKRSYLFQGFVRENPLGDDKTPENPIRRFTISPQIFNLIKAALMDPELENLPTDYEAGLDFTVSKTKKGQYADYSTSKWSRKETSLTEEEAKAIETYGLFNLAEVLPKKPGEVELRVIKEMFEASVDGEAYDPERWAAYYKPYNLQYDGPTKTESAPAQAEPATKVEDTAPWEDKKESQEAPTPVEAPVSDGGNKKADDILAMIRSRQSS